MLLQINSLRFWICLMKMSARLFDYLSVECVVNWVCFASKAFRFVSLHVVAQRLNCSMNFTKEKIFPHQRITN